ncbi:MAG: site-2 protease family protein [Planctomycetota bacterium]
MDPVLFKNALTIVLVLLSTAFHEMAHAFVATWLGDPTPGRNGRLTLNPIPHLQPVFTAVLLPVMMFMTQGSMMILASTPINPSYFRRPLRDHALVAVAGPITNIICAAVMIGILWIPNAVNLYSVSGFALSHACYLNLILAAFNMLPIPPLDGYWIFRIILPLQVRTQTDRLASSQASFIIVILLGSYLIGFVEPHIFLLVRKFLPH